MASDKHSQKLWKSWRETVKFWNTQLRTVAKLYHTYALIYNKCNWVSALKVSVFHTQSETSESFEHKGATASVCNDYVASREIHTSLWMCLWLNTQDT